MNSHITKKFLWKLFLIFIRSKRERSFLRNFFLICEFITQTYNLAFRKQFANTLFVESGKWYLGAHRGPWWKRKYPHIITMEKISQRFLSDVLLHHGVPPFPSWNRLLTLLSWILQSEIWELIEGYGEKGNLSDKNWKEAFWENVLRCMNATHRVTRFSSVISLLTQFSWNLQWDTC